MNPLISINISCLNRSEMLKECINSFIKQSFIDWELIVVDDGSEKDDLTFIKKMDSRIKYFRQKHSGMAVGLNLAMDKSSGEWIVPFGSDDLVKSNFLEEIVNAIKSNPQYDIFYSDHWLMKGDGKIKRAKYENIGKYNQKELYQKMLKKQLIAHGGTFWRKNKSPRYDESLSPADDWDFFLQAVENGLKFFHLPQKLWFYRVGHPRDSGTKAMEAACKRVLQKRGITI